MPRHKPHLRVGRPTRLTIDVAIVLGTTLKRGIRVADAARAAGISRPTLYRWLARGRAGDPRYARLANVVEDDWLNRLSWESLFPSPFLRQKICEKQR
jgi:hypothetical protein